MLEVLFCTVGADTTDTEGTEGAGGKMGDVADFFKKAVNTVGDVGQKGWKLYGDAAEALTGSRGIAAHTTDKASDWFQNEIKNKSDLRGAQLETFISGLPYAGDFLRGIEGVNRLEDLYNNTGKVPEYPSLSGVGAGAAGHAISQGISKIMDGKNDLYEYYSGTPDDFRAQMNYTYG